MPQTLDSELRRSLAERVRYYRELGIYDFYWRESPTPDQTSSSTFESEIREEMSARKSAVVPAIAGNNLVAITSKPEQGVADPVAALKLIREDLGDCTRCKLHQQGRKQIVFGVGNPRAELMFVGEGPGADEDAQGEPFVGRAGQLLNAMLRAIGLAREQVYIANVLKCRPPQNRDPVAAETMECLPFLDRQIALLRPKIMLVVGRIAAQNLLRTDAKLGALRQQVHSFGASGVPLVVTYHPAYLLRSPAEKRKAWEDLKFAREVFARG